MRRSDVAATGLEIMCEFNFYKKYFFFLDNTTVNGTILKTGQIISWKCKLYRE